MSFFNERMQTLCNEIVASHRNREGAICRLKDEAAQILADSRAFVKRLGEETDAETARCRAALNANHRERTKHVKGFRAKLRHELHETARHLRQTLNDNCSSRQKEVHDLLHGFTTAQHALAADLRAAAQHWHETRRKHSVAKAGHRRAAKES